MNLKFFIGIHSLKNLFLFYSPAVVIVSGPLPRQVKLTIVSTTQGILLLRINQPSKVFKAIIDTRRLGLDGDRRTSIGSV